MSFAISLIASLAPFVTPDVQASFQQWREDAQTLKAADAPLDAAGLHKYLAPQTATSAQLAALRDKLDDKSFQAREQAMKELIRLGRQAVPVLREAVKAGSEEMRRRAEKCLVQIDQQYRPETALAGVRRLAGFPSDEVLTTLMHFLPQAGSEEGSEQVIQALHQMMKVQGRLDPRTLKYLTDDTPDRRKAAAYLIAALGSQAQRQELLKTLGQLEFDARLQAARGCLTAGDGAGIVTLLDLLAGAPIPLAAAAQDVLQQVADLKGPDEKVLATETDRKAAQAAWHKWFREYGATLDLKRAGELFVPTDAQLRKVVSQFLQAINDKDGDSLDRVTKYPHVVPGGAKGVLSREEMLTQGYNSSKLNYTVGIVKKWATAKTSIAASAIQSAKKDLAKKDPFLATDWIVYSEYSVGHFSVKVVRLYGNRLYVIATIPLQTKN